MHAGIAVFIGSAGLLYWLFSAIDAKLAAETSDRHAMRAFFTERIDALQRDVQAKTPSTDTVPQYHQCLAEVSVLKGQLDAKTAELRSLRRKMRAGKEAQPFAEAKLAAIVPQQSQQQSQQRPSHPPLTTTKDIMQRLAPDVPCFAGSSRKPTKCLFSQGNREVPYTELQDLGANIFGPGSENAVMKLIDQSKAHWFDSFGNGPVVLYTRHHNAGGGDRLETVLSSIFPPSDEYSIQRMSLQPGDLVYDIGGNIGTTAVSFD